MKHANMKERKTKNINRYLNVNLATKNPPFKPLLGDTLEKSV